MEMRAYTLSRFLVRSVAVLMLLVAFAGLPGYAMAETDRELAGSIEILEPKYGISKEVFIRDNLFMSVRLLKDMDVSMSIVRWDGYDIVNNLERLKPVRLADNFANEYRTSGYRSQIIDAYITAYEKRIRLEFELTRSQEELKMKTGFVTAAEMAALEERRNKASRELSAAMIEYDAAAYQFRRIAQVSVYSWHDVKVGAIPTFRVTLEKPAVGTYLIYFRRNDVNRIIKVERIQVRAMDSAQDLPNNAYSVIKSSLSQ
ncbi:hypothetical protein [Acidaminobacter hydrogenoformans]|uniref:Uncharacterized protein n=1 Tax=Acidaminobacter hydrogenoformans DSM 2784 TaxID=1120920 RepID=A0A1G5RTF4_9FIRM|nr:hypothetical protein [Acidaminobacter hydrogenoformans]SCZ76589.1 hypothetical protein SAMN03080599_00317 [Acidaminobacter hydrogenoformans DSM 2784]